MLLHSGHPLAAVSVAVAVRDRFELKLEFQRDRISFHKVKTVNLYHVATTGLTDFAFCLRLRLHLHLAAAAAAGLSKLKYENEINLGKKKT